MPEIDNLDALEIRTEIFENGEWVVYQQEQGTTAAILPVQRHRLKLKDPAKNRTIPLDYDVKNLPTVS